MSAADCERRIRRLYGGPLPVHAGVLHVTSAWRSPDGTLPALEIGPDAPPSDHDLFVLNLARARCDAILTTGEILRRETSLTHEFQGPPERVGSLRDWRGSAAARPEAPWSVVLTSGRDIDLDHPLFGAAPRALVATSASGRRRLAEAAAARGIEVVGLPRTGLREVTEFLRRERAVGSVCVEAGPTTANGLYTEPLGLDELMLSVFEEPGLNPAVAGAAVPDGERLSRCFRRESEPCEISEPSGRWSFRRLWRPRTRARAGQRP